MTELRFEQNGRMIGKPLTLQDKHMARGAHLSTLNEHAAALIEAYYEARRVPLPEPLDGP
ncbi:MAG: hypothetical protein ACQGVC_04255 [Myxococcota bacterium]